MRIHTDMNCRNINYICNICGDLVKIYYIVQAELTMNLNENIAYPWGTTV